MQYVIVESISAFYFAKKKIKKKNICWASTSPKVCNFFFVNKLNYIEIEKLVTQKELNEIGKITKKICEEILFESRNIFFKKKYIDLRFIAGAAIYKKIHTIIYKNYLLNKLLNKTKKILICVGNPCLTSEDSFIGIGNFDNLFSVIGSYYKKSIKIIEYKENINLTKKDILTKGNNNFFLTKIISLLNLNFSFFLFKILRYLSYVDFFQNFLNNKNKKQIVIIKETDHIGFSFNRLLRKFSIFFFKENFKEIEKRIKKNKNKILKGEFRKSYNTVNNNFLKYLANTSLRKNQIIGYEKGLILISNKIFQYLQSVDKNFNYAENKFKKIISKLNNEFFIISNNALSPIESLFVSYCQNIGVKLFLFEHGLRGNSKIDKSFSNYYQQYKGDYGIYYWKKSSDLIYSQANQKIIIGGFPYETKNNYLNFFLKRFLVKINLKIPFYKQTIVVLSNLERNNDNYPYFMNDYEIVKNNKKIIKYLAKKFPEKIIVLKLYSTQRYLDIYNYQDLTKEFHNVRILRDISFDYLVDVFDEIYIYHASSTLLKCMSSKAKVYFLKTSKNDDIKSFIKKRTKTNILNIKFTYILNKKLNKISFDWVNFLK